MTKKYAIITNQETKTVDVGLGTDEQFYKSIGMTEMDVEQAYNGAWYLKGYAPQRPEPTPQEQIRSLESQITDRNIRCALLGDQYAIDKINEIEGLIAELREKIPVQGGEQ
ncbi:MAG: hypothetical protein PUK73_05100 [Spirochaetota bacterium]|uniref:hypothetical protein n=1 Tax=Candidatus Avelusimicrobium faecicola TaxID=3416205 RepID=UPI002A656CA3|nr:hypothetical protein [Spirochaetota bacterium]